MLKRLWHRVKDNIIMRRLNKELKDLQLEAVENNYTPPADEDMERFLKELEKINEEIK